MNWLEQAIDCARTLNPPVEVQDRGDWPGIGRLLNVVLPDGRQNSIVVRTGASTEAIVDKIMESVGRFERP